MESSSKNTTRRDALKTLALGALALSGGGLVSCSAGLKDNTAAGGSPDKLKIGYVSPRTGGAAAFAESDAFILKQVRSFFAKGITSGGKAYTVEILDRDTGSDPAKAAQIADELVISEQVDLVLVTSTPETIHPVADKCEKEGVPCISTIEPWQAFYFGRGATPDKPFTYTYHFFDGLGEIAGVETDLWKLLPTNKTVGVLWPNDTDGGAFRDSKNGYRSSPGVQGFTIVDPGAYENGTKDFSGIISTFKERGVEIVAGVPSPPDFATFWTQAAQQGFTPKIATISKAVLFESAVGALPNGIGAGIALASFWVPQYPFKSSLTGESAADLVAAYEKSAEAKGQRWNQGLGPNYALFEIANAVLSQASDPKDRKAVAAQIGNTALDTIAGRVDWTSGSKVRPVKNVSTIPMVGTQWVKADDGYDLRVVSNRLAPSVPTDGSLTALS